MSETRFYYRIEKITHRPAAEDIITIINEIREIDLQIARIVATGFYVDELQELLGKYSPGSYTSYDTKKGTGYNLQLLLINTKKGNTLVVESTMDNLKESIEAQKREENEIFSNLGLDNSILKI